MDVLDIPDYERWVTVARTQLDDATFAAAWAEGQKLTLDEAIAEAFGESPHTLMTHGRRGRSA